MTRQQRQRDELGRLCRSGDVLRAIDLAFEHFADFGQDADIVLLLSTVIDDAAGSVLARRRFEELRSFTSRESSETGPRFDAGRPGPTEA